MARSRKKAEPRQRDAALVMFLSLNMILLAFFILLVALAAPNETKEAKIRFEVKKAFKSFGGAFLSVGPLLDSFGISRDANPIEDNDKLEAYLGELTKFVEENKELREVSYEITTMGLSIFISNSLAFSEGSTVLREEGLPVYNRIYDLIVRTTNQVRIEGHTDNVPLRTNDVRDNWELSSKRALAVFRFMTANGEVPASRFKVAGYGPYRPIASNLTEDGRERNNRVSVVFEGRLARVGEE